MIHCLDKSRHGQPVNFQVEPDDRGLRVTIQEGGAGLSNVLSRFDVFTALLRGMCALAGFSLREAGEALQLAADEQAECEPQIKAVA